MHHFRVALPLSLIRSGFFKGSVGTKGEQIKPFHSRAVTVKAVYFRVGFSTSALAPVRTEIPLANVRTLAPTLEGSSWLLSSLEYMFPVTVTIWVGDDLPSMETWLSSASYLGGSQGSSATEPKGKKPLSEVSSVSLELMTSGPSSSAAISRFLSFCVLFLLVPVLFPLGINSDFFSAFNSFAFPGGE